MQVSVQIIGQVLRSLDQKFQILLEPNWAIDLLLKIELELGLEVLSHFKLV
jgi:hypothetical protein